MINFRNIVKVLLMAMFICAYTYKDGVAQVDFVGNALGNNDLSKNREALLRQAVGSTSGTYASRDEKGNVIFKNVNDLSEKTQNQMLYMQQLKNNFQNSNKGKSLEQTMQDLDPYKDLPKVENKKPWEQQQQQNTQATEDAAKDTAGKNPNGEVSANFCSGDFGIFSSLVETGQIIFQRLRDLIYVVAGFGIIAVAVGGFFGNLNWKWLGAIVISLVVIATAGELIVLVTGCEQFGSTLITNTMTHPTAMSVAEYQGTYTEDAPEVGSIQWNDDYAKAHPETYAGTKAVASSEPYDESRMEGYDITKTKDTYYGDTLEGMRANSARESEIAAQQNKAAENRFNENLQSVKQPKVEIPKLELPPMAPLN